MKNWSISLPKVFGSISMVFRQTHGSSNRLAILTPDSVNDGCWKNILRDLEKHFQIFDSFWVTELPMSIVVQLYGWKPPL